MNLVSIALGSSLFKTMSFACAVRFSFDKKNYVTNPRALGRIIEVRSAVACCLARRAGPAQREGRDGG